MNANATTSPRHGRLDVVQVLRFLAAALVVIAHSESRMVRVFPDAASSTIVFGIGDIAKWGHFGVDLFFVISGFIMYWVSRKMFGADDATRSFLMKRLVRVVPIYWLLTGFAVALLAIAPGLFTYRESLDLGWIAASLLFVPWTSPEAIVTPVLGLGWTLNFEMYFYACFSLLLLLPARQALTVLTVGFIACALAGSFFDIRLPFARQATSWLLVEFLAGIWIGRWIASAPDSAARWGRRLAPFAALVLLATIFFDPVERAATPSGNDGLRFVLWGLPCAALLLGALALRWQPSASSSGRTLVALGDASYSIYLVQVFALPAVGLVFRRLGLDAVLHFDLLILLMAAASIAVSYAFYLVVERPLTRVLQRYIAAAPRAAAASPASAAESLRTAA